MRVPYTNFKTRIGDTNEVGGCTFIGGEWKDVDTAEIFDNKKIVVFALPGAFTPTCSSQQMPGYEEKYDDLNRYQGDLGSVKEECLPLYISDYVGCQAKMYSYRSMDLVKELRGKTEMKAKGVPGKALKEKLFDDFLLAKEEPW